MSTERFGATILIIGSALFIITAFLPVSKVFAEPSPAAKLEIIASNRTAWNALQVLFGLSASIAAIGLSFVAYHLRGAPGAIWGYIGLAAVILGAVLWDWQVYLRAVDPEGFVEGRLMGWLFPAYTLLTQVGLLAFGVAYLRAGYAAWLGSITVGGAVIFFIIYLVSKDIPPLVYYVLTLIAAIRLMR